MFYLVDILVGFSALAAAAYCLVLSRRLRALTRIDGTVGGAVAVLSSQVDGMTRALEEARHASTTSQKSLTEQTERAEAAVRRLELLMASLQSAPQTPDTPAPRPQTQDRPKLPDPAVLGGSIFGPSAVAPRPADGAFWRDTAAHPVPAQPTPPSPVEAAPNARNRPRIIRHRRAKGAA